jgi:chromosome segregation ATPase
MKNFISTILIIVLIATTIAFFVKTTDRKIEEIKKQNEILDLRCDSLNIANDSIKIQMDSYTIKIDSMKKADQVLSADYIENQKQIKNIKQKYEKNNRIDNFSTPDIIRYFTDSI